MVRLRFFSFIKDLVGTGSCEIVINKEMKLRDFIKLLCNRFPALSHILIDEYNDIRVSILINGRTASWDDIVHDYDEVAIVPPSSGG